MATFHLVCEVESGINHFLRVKIADHWPILKPDLQNLPTLNRQQLSTVDSGQWPLAI